MATPTQTAAPQASAPQQNAPSAGQGGQGPQAQGQGATVVIETRISQQPQRDYGTQPQQPAQNQQPQQPEQGQGQNQNKDQAQQQEGPSKSGGFLKMLKGAADVVMELTGIGAVINAVKAVGKMFQGATEMATAQGQGNQASQGNHRGGPQQGQQRGQEQAAGRGGPAPEPQQQRAASSLTGAALAGVRAAAGELVNAGLGGAQQGRATASTARAPEAPSQGQAR